MMMYRYMFFALLVGVMLPLCFTRSIDFRKRPKSHRRRGHGRCEAKNLVEYNLTFYGDWSSKMFPKLYPRVRPPAQWSKLVGRSHDSSYTLWSLGQNASEAVQKFAEDADSSMLDQDAQAYRGIFDSFTAAAITSGMGMSGVRFLADGEHTKVSFMVKIIPSPDWFVGIESMDLCRNGRWRRKISVDLSPFDAGTDQGLTFTSPNWPSTPVEPIKQITNTDPDHPASSFYYPEQNHLPRIGHVTFTKVAEYRRRGRNRNDSPTGPNVIIFDNKEDDYPYEEFDSAVSSLRMPDNDANDDKGRRQDCLVSEWGEWSTCSQTCGYGYMARERNIVKSPLNGGFGCPKLREQATCGSMKNCKWSHFNYILRRTG